MRQPAPVPISETITETILAAHFRAGGGLVVSIADAMKLLNLGKTKLYSEIAKGNLPTIVVGGKRVFSIRQLIAFLEAREAQARFKRE